MQVKDLLVTGNVRVLGNLYTKDGPVGGGSSGGGGGGGDSITYRLTKSGSTITLTGSDGSSSSVTDADTNTTYTLSSLGAAPASHTHTKSQITDFPSSLPASDVYSWAKAASKPSYSWSEITSRPSSLPASDVYSWAKASSKPSYSWSEITSKPSSFTPSSHTHTKSQITDFPTSMTPTAHTHDDRYYTESEVNNLIATSGCKIASGTYVGTGKGGPNNKNSLTFSFEPKLVYIAVLSEVYNFSDNGKYGAHIIMIKGQSVSFVRYVYETYAATGTEEEYGYLNRIEWSGNTVSWYHDSGNYGGRPTDTYFNTLDATYGQLNNSSFTYRYVAIG